MVRWLEDPDSAETKEFVQAQNAVTHEHLNKWPQKEQFRSKLTALYDYERFSCPFRPSATDGYFFFFYNSGLQAQSSLYRQKSYNLSIDSAELFFDPNTLREDGTASLTTYSFSESGAYFAYGVSYNGSDWVTINVKNTKTLKDSATDVLEWAKFTGIAWTHDGDGFFYQRFEKPPTDDAGTETGANVCGMLCYHKIGTEQSKDVLWFQDKANPENMSGAEVTDDGRYLVMTITSGCDPVNKLYLVDLKSHMFHGESGGPKFVKVSDNFEAEYSYITNEDSKFFFKTNLKAPRYKVVTYDLENTSAGFVDVIAQSTDVLQFAVVFNENKLAVSSLKDVKSTLAIYSLNGKKIHDVALPIGSVDSITGKKSLSDIFFKFSSFTNPGIIYRYDGKDSSMDTIKETKLSVASTDNFSVEQVFYPSLDGTKIPMFIISKKDMVKNGSNPTLLYGYGGFNISLTPMFSPTWMCFVAHLNGIVAVPNIRGGGEYGEDWHKAGSLAKKQNCFDDFQCAAKWLVANKYSSHSKIGINGGSNGGLLVGACVNQAPELFGCAMADVGVMDMLRFHKFTIGHAWKSDYGTFFLLNLSCS